MLPDARVSFGLGRLAHPTLVDVHIPDAVDCVMGEWSDWSHCRYVSMLNIMETRLSYAVRFIGRLSAPTAALVSSGVNG